MPRRIVSFGLIALLLAAPAAADSNREETKSSSTTKRVVWTIVGAGAGFAAGAYIGLHKFDDAINSDRKVWISAIVGAAAGGVAGALLGGRGGSSPSATKAVRPAEVPLVTWSEALHGPTMSPPPRQRLR